MEAFNPFSYIFGTEVIEEDLSELKSNTCFASGNGQETKVESDANTFSILSKYSFSKEILEQYANTFIADNFGYDCDFAITTSWMTTLTVGESVHYHNHKNSIWSGVFYFDEYTNKSCALQFRNPILQTVPFQVGPFKSNDMCSDIGIKPEHNLLVLFPSWIYHYSAVNKEKDRKSLAFNLMPKGLFGSGDSTIVLKN